MVDSILIENQKEGTPREIWDAPSSDQIEGFATDISVNHGERIDFKINVNATPAEDVPYHIEIYRLGYYGGDGAHLVYSSLDTGPLIGHAQPDPIFDPTTGLVDAGNWSVSAGWNVPADAVSGVYLVKLVRDDNGATNQIPFVVRNDDGPKSDIILQTSDTTWQAYNGWAGNNGQVGGNFYGDPSGTIDHPDVPDPGAGAQDRAYAVSYNRPIITRDGGGAAAGAQDYLFGADFAAIYWLEKNGYDVSYISGVDTDRLGADYLIGHKAYISVGHDEYWSGQQRLNVEDARDAGVNLLFWSGNEVYWKTRFEDAISPDGTAYRTLVCYKETWANLDPNAGPEDYANIDPTNDWTGTWRDMRFVNAVDAQGNYIAGGSRLNTSISGSTPDCFCLTGAGPETTLTGQLFGPDGTGQFGVAIDVPGALAGLRVWRDTTVATTGQLNIAPGILGYEWDIAPNDEFRPEGLIKLSETVDVPWGGILVDQGNVVQPGVATHNLSLYRAQSGALVFSAGTVFWSWALSDQHDSSPYVANIENVTLQQFAVNMFADMGIQPGVTEEILASHGLVKAVGITDTVAARATLNDIPDTVHKFQTIVISGTATDDDGNSLTTEDGRVAVVEISLDNGVTWKVAQGTTDWSYTWRPTTEGTYTIKARAIDDSLNVTNIVPAQDTVTVIAPVTPNAYSLFDPLPVNAGMFTDGQPLELGMKFSASQDGRITELKYFRAAADAGDVDVREGHLWGPDGTLLATATFNSGSGQSGWQVATLSAPVAITAGSEYIVSYHTENNYVATSNFFNPSNEIAFDGIDNNAFSDPFGMLSAPQSTVVGGGGLDGNGVYNVGAAPVMPNETFGASNYWVDVTFGPRDPSAPSITSSSTFSVAENQTAVGEVHATDPEGHAILYAIAGGADAAKFSINSATGALAFLSAPNFEAPSDAGGNNVYDVTVSASDGTVAPVTQNVAVTVTNDVTEAPPSTVSLFNPALPVNAGVFTDGQPLELGMKFSASQDGRITELKYFRGAADAGDVDVREGHLWGPDGTLLATATFNSGSDQSGWQVATLSAPVAITAGSEYIVSYHTENNYVATSNFFNPSNEIAFDGIDNNAFSDPFGMLSAPQSTVVGGGGLDGNGVYNVGAAPVMPNETFGASNYWVDVTFGPRDPSAPSITSSSTFSVAENQTAVGEVHATDPEGHAILYAIAGGADAAKFSINSATGALAFLSAPNFEAPSDAGGNNVYDVTVSASDGTVAPVTQNVAVTVTNDVTEAPPSTVSLFNPALPVNAGVFTDGQPLELGMKFSASQDGRITELKYFRGAADAGDVDVREGHLWGPDGTLLATATFNSGSDQSGWQVATLSAPVAITAGSEYIVSYHTENNYVATSNFFNPSNEIAFDGIDNNAFSDPFGMLSAPQSTVVGGGGLDGNGVYNVGAAPVMPNETFGASNYWVDVTFDTTPNGAPLIDSSEIFSLAENQTAVGEVHATDPEGHAILYAIAGGADAAKFSINSATGALAFLSAPNFEAPSDAGGNNVYDVTVSASDGTVAPVTQNVAVTVTNDVTEAPPSTVSLFNPALPVNAGVFTDGQPLELGMKFSASQDGRITELKYFRGAADAGDVDVREGHLWGPDGTLLATATFNSGSDQSGWQVATLSAPVAITAGSEYIVSYHTENNYVATSNFFNPSNEIAFDGIDNNAFSDPFGMLSAPQSTVVGGGGLNGNGVYKVGAALEMPNETFNAANYWVDVTFHPTDGLLLL